MADSLIYDLCKAVGKQLLKKACLLRDVPEEAKKMEQNLESITAVLKAAEQREIEADVKIWLSDLKTVAYDIEDVLDDCRIAELQMGDEAGTSQQGTNFKAKVTSPVISSPYVWTKRLKSDYDIAQRIKSINEKLGEIDKRKNRFNFLTSINRINERPTSAYGNYTVVRRHEEIKAEVIEKLVHGDSKGNVANGNHIPIISLVGMGGIGKTTLAQLVYNDHRVKGHFPKTIWVCVGNTFNETKVAREIAKGFGVKVSNDSTLHSVLSDIDLSITKFDASNTRSNTKIDSSNTSKMFLLVLDDVWEDSEGKWSDILGCLGKVGKEGSRILMTTRDSEFSKKMPAGIVPVEELPAEDAWSLFSYYAFPMDSRHREEVKDIAEELVAKCHGLPLALEVLGRSMTGKTSRSEWDYVRTSNLWEVKFEERVFYSLAVSYLELSSEAKRCFAFCSIFPKDTAMTKNNLIRLWMAQGYLQGDKGVQMEDLGEQCFQSLESRSFFRVRETIYAESADTEVTMHDLVHDFARYISHGEVAILDSSLKIHGGGVISKNLRHLAISGKARESNCPHSNALHTLFLSTDSTALLEAVCSNISYVRALDIQIYVNSAKRTPVDFHFKGIKKLEHLRYLKLRTNISTVLPKEICGLPFLQTLDVSQCFNVKTLPGEIGRLTSLRHLLLSASVPSLPKELGKLSSLRTLNYFSCSRGLDNDVCNSIEDLRGLNNLRGELQLKMLSNVANVDEATRAELSEKKQIRKLSLEFGDGDALFQSEVLEALQPAEGNLAFLEIKKHSGRRCPRWIGKMLYLKEVLLGDVSMESLPEMGMLRFLEKLSICRAPEVKHVGTEFFGTVEPDKGFFPKLTDLKFAVMSRWEHWERPEVRPRNGVRVTIMPSLRCLSIDDCDALQTLPRFLEHVPLERLELSGKSLLLVEAAEIDYPNRWQIGDILLPQTIKHIQSPYLTLRIPGSEVSVHGLYDGITNTIHTTAVPRYIIDLTYLKVIYLSNIKDESLPPFGSLSFLLELNIWDAHNVRQVGDEFLGISSNNTTVFPRLEKLTFGNMALQKWVDPVHGGNINLSIMPSLWYLQIFHCKILKSLPHFFDSVPLRKLDVMGNEEGDMVRIRESSNEEGDMVRIRESSSMDEATACEGIITRAATLPLPKFTLREITLSGVKNYWYRDWGKYCRGLRKLSLQSCGQPSVWRLGGFRFLEFLEIYSGDISNLDIGCTDYSRVLHCKMPVLHCKMPYLRRLSIRFCPELNALPSFIRSARLEELDIVDCPGLATWWINEAREDWRNWKSNIRRFNFPDSETEDESP